MSKIKDLITDLLSNAPGGETASNIGNQLNKYGLGPDWFKDAVKNYDIKYAQELGLDQFDNQDNPYLDMLRSTAIKSRNFDYALQYADKWNNVVGTHEMSKQDQMDYYANQMASLSQAGLNPIMATTGGSFPTVSTASASAGNINAYEFLTKEQNKLNIQYMKSITDIIKRLIPDNRKVNSSSDVKGTFTSNTTSKVTHLGKTGEKIVKVFVQ